MKVLFLDVDGVLNSDEQIISLNNLMPLGDKQLLLLKQIVDETDCKVVLSSSWRLNLKAKNKITKVLDNLGIEIIGCTKNLGQYPRFKEIKNWLEENKHDQFVVLDDEDHAGVGFEEHFVQTQPQFGLTQKDAQSVIAKMIKIK